MTSTQKLNKCTESDYRALFVTWSEPLHWLCYTLTGDEELSEKMLEAALEQSLKGADQVFRGWMMSWARRLIIKACIHNVQPWKSPSGARTSTRITAERGFARCKSGCCTESFGPCPA